MVASSLDEEERRSRLRLVARLGWQAAELAKQLLKEGEFQDWSLNQLRERHRLLCGKLGHDHSILCASGYQIDDAFIEWEKAYGAEVRALEYRMYHRFR
jgi:hypothetical protein